MSDHPPADATYTAEPAFHLHHYGGLRPPIALQLERECKRAMAEPSYSGTFRRLHLNQRTSVETAWLSLSDWDACQRELPDLSGRECYAGLDLSTTTDLSAFVLVFPPRDEEPYYVLPFFWVPERKLSNRADRVPYREWQRQGLITVTPGDVVDYDRIRADIVELAQTYRVVDIRFDPWNATQLATQLAEGDGLVRMALSTARSIRSPVRSQCSQSAS